MPVHRREFLKMVSALGTGVFLPSAGVALNSCAKQRDIPVVVGGPDYTRGHRIRSSVQEPEHTEELTVDVLVIGAGISGLSTAYTLRKEGINSVAVLELNDHIGGNSSFSSNDISSYPHGAHYISQPNTGNTPLLDFLRDKGIITGFDEHGRILYRDTDLCFDPEERLFIRGSFQEGLVPSYGLQEHERAEIVRFLKLMDFYSSEKGSDGRYFFDIPHSAASTDSRYDTLDAQTFRSFLTEKGFKGEYLLWFIDYCCRDDFGGGLDRVSAWAGINYFASHKPHPSNTDPVRVLTWPEGNGRLVHLLAEGMDDSLRTGCLVHHVRTTETGVSVSAVDFRRNTALRIVCSACVLAVPPFVAARILDAAIPYPRQHLRAIEHAPWAVASIVLSSIPGSRRIPLCWDNVGYGTRALGYINNQHQSLSRAQQKECISLYMLFDNGDLSRERTALMQRSASEWRAIVLAELEHLHKGITDTVEHIDIWRWGHGMVMPTVGLLKSGILDELARPVDNRIFFAHTDLSGYSTFEEGFDWGYRTAHLIKSSRV